MNQTAEISETVKAQAPNCIEVEQTLLGTLLANNAAYVGCSWLTPADFFEGLHARIFEALQNCLAADGKYTPMMAMAQFRDDGTLAAMGIPASQYMAGLVASQDAANTVPWLAKMIRNDSMRRRIADEAGKVIEAALNPEPGKTALDLSLSAIDVFTAIGRDVAGGGSREAQPIVKTAAGITDRLNDALMNGVVHDGFAYAGSKTLSEAIGGWRRGRFYVIGGRPGMGKTTVGLSWLLRTAGKGYGVAFFSLEMGADELTERALSDLSYVQGGGVQYQTIARNEVNAKGLERLFAAQRVMNDLPLYIDDRAGLTLAQIRAAAQQQKQRLEARGLRLDVVCIDHMGLVRASERYAGNKVAETEEISAALKVMAKELDCAVIALMQLNRGVESRDVKRPTLSDLRWSGAIEQDADCVMFAYRESYYLERDRKDDMADEQERLDKLALVKDRLEIIVAKQRGGSCPTLDFHCDMGCSAVRDIQ